MSVTPIASPASPASAGVNRFDLYVTIHKALRLFMADTLPRLGWLDTDDAADVATTLAQVEALLLACRQHLEKENKFLHPAIEARQPGGTERVAAEHVGHLEAIAALEADVAALRALPTAPAALRLYRHLARFMAENLEHMQVEETQHNAVLWACYTDAELEDIHRRILASIDPAEMRQILRWMVPAMSPAERAGMLSAMQQQLPSAAMHGVLDTVRPHLDARAWAKLARALALSNDATPAAN